MLGRVVAVQLIPSGEVAAAFELVAKATNTPFPNVIALQPSELGKVLAVHVTPSGEVYATELLFPRVTKTPFPYATEK